MESAYVVGLSARTGIDLRALLDLYCAWLGTHAESTSLEAIAPAVALGRRHFSRRHAFVASTTGELLSQMLAARPTISKERSVTRPRIAFAFSGQGSQWHGMGRFFYETQPIFRASLDRLEGELSDQIGCSLSSVMWGDNGRLLDDTRYAQPALYAFQVALAQLWMSWGVRPAAVIGHSVGEFAAAYIAGALGEAEGASLIAERGRLMRDLCQPGAMLSVNLEAEQLRSYLSDASALEIAALNAADRIVLSGQEEAVERLAAHLQTAGVRFARLPVSRGFHSSLMEPVLDPLARFAEAYVYSAPTLPWVSNVTGRLHDHATVTAAYWARHAREPVQFRSGLDTLHALGCDVLLEIGPQPVLNKLVRQKPGGWVALSSFDPAEPEGLSCTKALAHFYETGVDIDWLAIYGDAKGVPSKLPKYVFNRERYWVDPPAETATKQGERTTPRYGLTGDLHNALGKLLADVLEETEIDWNQPLVALGLDSLMAMQIVNAVRAELFVSLRAHELLEHNFSATRLVTLLHEQFANGVRPALQQGDRVQEGRQWPLSRAQKRLWFLHALSGNGAAYNMHYAYRLIGRLNEKALQRALQTIFDRHESFRTTYHEQDGVPFQVVADGGELEFRGGKCAADSVETELERFRRQPFDLAKEQLLRVELLQVASKEHVLILNMHHIASDGWSMGRFFAELQSFYAAYASGSVPQLDVLPARYVDFVRSEEYGPNAGDNFMPYWAAQLHEAPPLTTLPSRRARPAEPSYEGGVQFFSLGGETTARLRELAKSTRCTLYTVLMAAFTALVARRTGASDIVIGTPIANRAAPEFELLIGAFLNFVAVRSRVDFGAGFDELLRDVRKTVSDAIAHQDAPFDEVVRYLGQQGSASPHPIFQIVFEMIGASVGDIGLEHVGCERLPFSSTGAKFDLTVVVEDRGSSLSASIEYSLDLYSADEVERFVAEFKGILDSVARMPTQRIGELPLVREDMRPVIVDPKPGSPNEVDLYGLIAMQMRCTPDAIALVHDEQALTYSQLERAVHDLAGRLQDLRLEREFRVGVCLRRTPEMLIAMLAVLKAGGCYVPIDPQYPDERQNYMLRDSSAQVLIVDAGGIKKFGGFRGYLIDASSVIGGESRERHLTAVDDVLSDQLAYIIYTSGSTGKPKGVAVTHRNGINLLLWARDAFPSIQLEVVLATTSICFDISVFELFFPLAFGGRVVLAENLLEAHALIESQSITLINTVPSVMDGFLQRGDLPKSVRIVNLAGEPLSRKLVDRLYAYVSVEQVANLYGPTESTVYSTWSRVTKEDRARPAIGRPVDGTYAYIVDDALRLAPDGTAGELLLGGAGVSRGYFCQPGLTAERFLPDPFSGVPGARLYRSGDICRRLPNGEIDYIQRNDYSIKIRGFRVELGEIDHHLQSFLGVLEGVTVVQSPDLPTARLVSFIVPADVREESMNAAVGAPVDSSMAASNASRSARLCDAVAAHLASKLPSYSVPSIVVALDRLPRTLNGKVDRKTLTTSPVQQRKPGDCQRDLTPTQDAIAQIWSSILKLPQEEITFDDDFFHLGGNSLLVIQLIARLRDKFSIHATIRTMFDRRTLLAQSELTETLIAERAAQQQSIAPKNARKGVVRI